MAKKENQPASDSTEQKIFDAAHEVFTQKGMDGAKMQEIADPIFLQNSLAAMVVRPISDQLTLFLFYAGENGLGFLHFCFILFVESLSVFL